MVEAVRIDLLWPSERFHKAVRGLAVSPKRLRQRIGDVFAAYLSDLEPGNLPPEIGAKLRAYRDAWRSLGDESLANYLGLVAVWARNLTWKQARDVANWVVDAHDEINLLWREDYEARDRTRISLDA